MDKAMISTTDEYLMVQVAEIYKPDMDF